MLRTVLQNFGSLTTMRILSRIIHFMLKTYLIRTELDEEVLAHMLHLDLLLTTSLHVARSCFKPSYQKVQNQEHIIKSSMNIMSFGVLATVASTIVVSLMQHYQFISSGKSLSNFTDAIILYSIASVCESIAEKYMVESLIKFQYFRIGLIQVVSIVPKTIFIIIAVVLNWFSSIGIAVFGISQVLYSFTMMAIFFILSSNKAIFLQPIQTAKQTIYFDSKSKAALKQFSLLSFLKLILQQFQQIVLVIKDISHISSVFSLINNLGSIVVRYLFAPLNQIIFNHFSRGKEEQSIKALESFLKITIYFSVLIVGFGFNYSEVVLRFLYGQKWVSQESVSALRTFMVLLIFLGLNGIIEAFLFAKGKQTIKKYNFLSIITTGIYLACTVFLLQLDYGAAGLFLGKIINMGSRILLCWYLQLRFHINLLTLIKQSLPSPLFFVVSAVIFLISHEKYGFVLHIFSSSMFTLALGVVLFGLNLIPIVFENRALIIEEVKKRWPRGKQE